MDAVAVEAALEVQSDCSDRTEAAASLERLLENARAPRRSATSGNPWTVSATVSSGGPNLRKAAAEIRDDRGTLVAERALSDRSTGSCLALVHAVGAWAQIVVDDAVVREADQGPTERREVVAPKPSATPPASNRPTDTDEGGGIMVDHPHVADAQRSVDVGALMFLQNGVVANGGIVGASPFVAIAFPGRWVLRPAAMVGVSTARTPFDRANHGDNVTATGTRVDFCRRLPGNYMDQRGLELDVCAGGDLFRVWGKGESHWSGALGPSAVFRGQIGHDLALELRSSVGMNPFVPVVALANEVGASMRFR